MTPMCLRPPEMGTFFFRILTSNSDKYDYFFSRGIEFMDEYEILTAVSKITRNSGGGWSNYKVSSTRSAATNYTAWFIFAHSSIIHFSGQSQNVSHHFITCPISVLLCLSLEYRSPHANLIIRSMNAQIYYTSCVSPAALLCIVTSRFESQLAACHREIYCRWQDLLQTEPKDGS